MRSNYEAPRERLSEQTGSLSGKGNAKALEMKKEDVPSRSSSLVDLAHQIAAPSSDC